MSAEHEDLVFDLGPQNDGEPVAVATVADPTPEPPAEPEAGAEPIAEPAPEPEPEKTPEEIEEHKRQTGSARARAKAERLAEENRQLKERLDRLEQRVDPVNHLRPANQQTPVLFPDPDEPQLDNFETFADYNKAAIRYEAQKIVREAKEESEALRQRKEIDEKTERGKAMYDDFSEVMQDLPMFPPAMASVIAASEHTAELLYHLGTHPEEYKRINSLLPGKQALEVARLESRFTRTPAPASKPVSKAPRPPSPVSAPSAPRPSDDGRIELY